MDCVGLCFAVLAPDTHSGTDIARDEHLFLSLGPVLVMNGQAFLFGEELFGYALGFPFRIFSWSPFGDFQN